MKTADKFVLSALCDVPFVQNMCVKKNFMGEKSAGM